MIRRKFLKVRRGWTGRAKKTAPTGRRGMWGLLDTYLDHLQVRGYSPGTITARQDHVQNFLAWCDERSLSEPTEVTQPVIERYQRWLYYFRRPNGRPLTLETQNNRLGIVKQFFRWLTRQHLTLFNPAAEIELPRLSHRLPRDILTAAEAEAVMAVPNVETPLGIRDRAILETFYSTGVRRVELVNLALYDLDAARGTLMVREGKGRKDRVVPIGRRAQDWIDKYLTDVRPHHVVDTDVTYLFLTIDGGPINSHMLGENMKKYLKAAGITKNGACHIWRHTVATAMLENGADIRFIQDLLGHADVRTTQVYTRVSIKKLQEIHRATHPAELAYRELTDESSGIQEDARQLLDELAAQDEDEREQGESPPPDDPGESG